MALVKQNITIGELAQAGTYFGHDEHYSMMNSLVQPYLNKLPVDQIPEDIDDFLVRFMLAVSDWNGNAYGTGRKSAMQHYYQIEPVFKAHWLLLMDFRQRDILSFDGTDEATIITMFDDFDAVLSHVGAAKSFHLLAPHFFIAWDNAIRKGYGLSSMRYPGRQYLVFLKHTHEQVIELQEQGRAMDNILKLIDQYNFWHFTRKRPNVGGM